MRALPFVALLSVLLLCSWGPPADARASEVGIEDAYVRAVPPGQRVTAAFFVAVNHGNTPHAIVAAESDAAEHTELHEHVHDQGVMRMREVERVEIPAAGRVAFQPGGYHIMLIGLKRALKPGDRIHLTLVLEDGTRIDLEPEVRPIEPHDAARDGHHGMKH